MAKFCGIIGFIVTEEVKPGVWVEHSVEKKYYGDILRNSKNFQSSGELNDNVSLSNQISIIANGFAIENLAGVRYAEYMGAKWKVTSVDASTYPRMILTLGGVYNGKDPE